MLRERESDEEENGKIINFSASEAITLWWGHWLGRRIARFINSGPASISQNLHFVKRGEQQSRAR